MDPISITCIAVAGSIVAASMGRFISKKYHSYQSRVHEHGLEMTSEETLADGAHRKTTLKFHGNNQSFDMKGAENQERGDPEAVKALSSLATVFSAALGSNQTSASIDSDSSVATNASSSKHSMLSDLQKGLSSAVKALKTEFSNKDQSVEKKANSNVSLDNEENEEFNTPTNAESNVSSKASKIIPLSAKIVDQSDKPLYFISSMSTKSAPMFMNGLSEEKDSDTIIMVVRKKPVVVDNKLEGAISFESGSEEYFDARESDGVRTFRDDDLIMTSISGGGDIGASFSNEF